jgi:hypothetical protein
MEADRRDAALTARVAAMHWIARVLLMPLVPLLAGAAVGTVYWYEYGRRGPAADEGKAPLVQRGDITLKFQPDLAQSYGIRAVPAVQVSWRPQPTVFGRVVPNPQAAAELRVPFAGLLKAVPAQAWPRLGDHVQAQQVLALMETRLTPAERVDIRAKGAEARAKHQGADKAVAIQDDRLGELEKLNVQGGAAKREVDAARLALLEAQTQREAALAQAKIYEQALAVPEGKSALVRLAAPLSGEVTELAAQPGLAVEPGYVLLKIVDFWRVLVRLEFPIAVAPGSAPQVESASQRIAALYALDAPPGAAAWRPGLYVRASFADPAAAPRPAVAVPATALLYHQGRTLVYVQLGRDRFQRREVEVLGRDGDTVILGGGVHADESVVAAQAQVLLSAEFRRDTDDDD